MTTIIDTIMTQEQLRKEMPDIKPGDIVRVHQKVKEGDPSTGSGQVKERIQIFEGLVLAKKHGKGISATITVRKISQGVGVERIFPIHAPFISKIEVAKHAKVRKAKLYYLRDAKGKKAHLKARELGVAVAKPKQPEIQEVIAQEEAQ